MFRVASLTLLVGCASASNPGTGVDAGDDAQVDATPLIDAVPIDAAPMLKTLSQNSDATTLTNTGSVQCSNPDTGYTSENSWYRVFKLSEFGITSALVVSKVSFGIAVSTGTPTIDIKLGTYAGTVTTTTAQLDTAMITPIMATTHVAPATTQAMAHIEDVPIAATIPAGAQLIVEIHAADLTAMSKSFYLGGNNATDTAPAYLRAPGAGCTIMQPRSMDDLAFATSSPIITVTGTYQP